MFNNGNGGYSLSDIAAATGNNNGFGNNWGGDWWIILLFLFAFNGGWGNGGIFGGGVSDGYVLASDFSNLERKIDTVNTGLCDGFYAMNTGMLNGFAGVNNNITQNTIGNMQNTNAITAQITGLANSIANVGCDLGNKFTAAYADLNYNLASQECNTRQAVADAKADIIAEVNAGTRSILDFLTQDKIATLITENQSLRTAASQAAQNAYLINALQPSPVPAYIVANPNTAYNPCGCGTL